MKSVALSHPIKSEYVHVREIFADAKAATAGEDKNPHVQGTR